MGARADAYQQLALAGLYARPGSGTVGVASPNLMITHARTATYSRYPEVNDARLAQAQ